MGTIWPSEGERPQCGCEVSEVLLYLQGERREINQSLGVGDRRWKPGIIVALHDLEAFDERQ